jgi:hypothetical protein
MRKLVTVVAVVAALVGTGSSASAHGGHRSCGPWGSIVIADLAVHVFHPLGQTISSVAQEGGMGGPVAGFHQAFCVPEP